VWTARQVPIMKQIKIGLVGAGMFGGDVHLRTYAELQRSGISPHLGRIGMDDYARALAPVRFELAAIATRTARSAERARKAFKSLTGHAPRIFHGDCPWKRMLRECSDLDVLGIATPDNLHTPVILDALGARVHVLTEKPMCLDIHEADQILAEEKASNRIVAVDMHKRYDPDHLRVREDIRKRIGRPLYGTAYLEEPLEVSNSTFEWAEESDPFSYVGSHWVDLFLHYYGSKPAALTAVGQKARLAGEGIDAYDAVQVRVDFKNGMSIQFQNNWITPPDFEGPVNQGHEIVGTRGKVESDQQYRGLRWWEEGGGSRTANNHFTRDVRRPKHEVPAYVGYGVDSLVAGLTAICRSKFLKTARKDLAGSYPDSKTARLVTAIIHAARLVRDLNFEYLRTGRGTPVTARFGKEGITLIDPCQSDPTRVFQVIYDRPI
jgi:predicted dehydrogenase